MALVATGEIDPQVLAEQEEWEDVQGVFALIDHQRKGSVSEAALAQALLSTSLLDEAGSRASAAQASAEGKPLDAAVFKQCLQDAVQDTTRGRLESSKRSTAATPSIGSALLCAHAPEAAGPPRRRSSPQRAGAREAAPASCPRRLPASRAAAPWPSL